MQNKILLFIVIILGSVYFIGSFKKETPFFYNEVTIKDSKTSEIFNIEMEKYLIGVLAAEIPASFEYEALKAQAIASRTYAYYKVQTSNKEFDLTTDSTTQNYIDEDKMKEKWQNDFNKYYNKIKKAINETHGMVLTYNDEVISAYYFAMSNGYTEDSNLVFSENKDYLKSVESKEDTTNHNYKVITTVSKNEFCKKLNIECGNLILKDIKRSSTNRINEITINNNTFKGTEFRKLLSLRSTDFLIEIDEIITITTYGYGHGVGMSQYGANTMATNGYSYEKILAHYYSETKIKNINSIKI